MILQHLLLLVLSLISQLLLINPVLSQFANNTIAYYGDS